MRLLDREFPSQPSWRDVSHFRSLRAGSGGIEGHIPNPYDSGDHLHPNDAGYRAMAQAIDIGLL